MQPLVVQLPGFYVAGQTVRTTNQDETRPETAKSRRCGQTFRHLARHAGLWVYSNYASDAGGPFDVTAGSAAESGLHIQPGRYLVFQPVAPCRRRLSQAGKPSGPTSSNTRKSNAAS